MNTEYETTFIEALYKTRCSTCRNKIQWEANFDADGTTYSATCCNLNYYMSPLSVTISIEPEKEEES